MLRTGRLRHPQGMFVAPLRHQPLDRCREPRYRGPWRLPGPDLHRLAALSLTPGYITPHSFPSTVTPGLLDAHSHQPTRQRERAMKGFRSAGRTQRFLSAFSQISPHFRPRRHRMTAPDYRTEMHHRFTTWDQVTGVSATV
jgi:hypothetical protein